MNQKKLIITLVIIYFITAIGAYLGTSTISSAKSYDNGQQKMVVEPTVPAEPLTEECPINGVMYGKTAKAAWDKRRPLAVVIENHDEARPQSGLSSAQVVYEGVSEGGVTRFLGIYLCEGAKNVGPIRSARVHFINLLREWGQNPLYAHVGGANCDETTGSGCGNGAPADALGLIEKLGWRMYNDLDQFRIGMPVYRRDLERLPDVAWEHTTYASTDSLWKYAGTVSKGQTSALTNVDEEGVSWNKDWKPWNFTADEVSAKRGTISPIAYNFYDVNESEYGVRWEYDAINNVYKRINGGQPHIDLNTNKQITAKNVFVIEAVESGANDDYPGGHVVYDLIGSGKLMAFQNGNVIEGTWEKEDLDSKMLYLDEDGKEIPIVRGVVWVSLIPAGNEVTYGAKAINKTDTKRIPSVTAKPKTNTKTVTN